MKMTVTDTHYNTQSFNPEGEFTEEAIWSLDTQWGQNIFEITHPLISMTPLLHI